MARIPVSVVVLLADGPSPSRVLASLAPQLGPDADVVLCGTPDQLARTDAPGARRVVAEPAALLPVLAGAVRAAHHGLVLVVCGDGELGPRSLHAMAGAMVQNPALHACAPPSTRNRAERRRTGGRDLSTTLVVELDRHCLLVRRDCPDLALEGRGASGRLARVDTAVYTRPGRPRCPHAIDPDAPLVTLAMIVKDEEGQVAGAIASAVPLVDDIVVYDTGSTDRTREVARAAGARVVEGFWDDDFAAARNRAMAAATTPWVLFLDADERIVVDEPTQLRRLLAATTGDAVVLPCRNLGDRGGVNLEFRLTRLLRQGRVRWDRPLHEQVVHALTGQAEDVRHIACETAHLLHEGYRSDVMEAKDKLRRNYDVAVKGLAAARESGDPARVLIALVNAARSTLPGCAGREESLAWFEEAWQLPRTGQAARFQVIVAAANAVSKALDLGRPELAQTWRDRFLQVSGLEAEAAVLSARIAAADGRLADALAALDTLPQEFPTMYERVGHRADHAAWRLALAVATGQDVTDALTDVLRVEATDVDLNVLLTAHAGDADALVRWLHSHPTPALTKSVCGQAIAHPDGPAVLQALHRAAPSSMVPLAAAAALDPAALSIEQAVYWSFAFRSTGLAEHCPLTAIRTGGRSDRAAVACAILAEVCGDEEASVELPERLAAVEPGDEDEVLRLLATFTPRLAATVVAD